MQIAVFRLILKPLQKWYSEFHAFGAGFVDIFIRQIHGQPFH